MLGEGRAIRVNLASGTPQGLLCYDTMNWTGQVCRFPVEMMATPEVITKLAHRGVFLLLGVPVGDATAQDSRPAVYVGYATENNLLRTIEMHLRSFVGAYRWLEAVVLLSSQLFFDYREALYIARQLHGLLQQGHEIQQYQHYYMAESDQHKATSLLLLDEIQCQLDEYLQAAIPILGFCIPHPAVRTAELPCEAELPSEEAQGSMGDEEGELEFSLRGMSGYHNFGFRQSWLQHFFDYGIECFMQGQLGNRQYDSLRVWLREAGLLMSLGRREGNLSMTDLATELAIRGAGSPLVWGIIWANLARSSAIVRWYTHNALLGRTYTRVDLITLLGGGYSLRTRTNAISSLSETLRHSPIGSVLQQGVPSAWGASYQFHRQGWDNPDPIAILYALVKQANEIQQYTFVLNPRDHNNEMDDYELGQGPMIIFGLSFVCYLRCVQDIAKAYPDYVVLHVDDQGRYTITLNPAKDSLSVLVLHRP